MHPLREAVARCPECRNSFCRECVTEHEGRVVCAACLKRLVGAVPKQRRSARWVLASALPIAGGVIAWVFFYGIGRLLMLIPASVHDGSVWGK
ncbi:MAG TPA: hypothetical protein VKU01_20885 [Bryobacteraceae bacterium]|nr:hypothetical protein [Bryobacteraceae bacterium]